MNKFKLMLVVGAAAASFASAAHADPFFTNVLDNWNQTNFATVTTHLDINAAWTGGDLRGTGLAIGNNFTASVEGSTEFLNYQTQLAEVGSKVVATLTDIGGTVDLQSVAICNNASLNATKAGAVSVRNEQRCQTLDPFAVANVQAYGVGGDLNIGATSIANNLSVSGETGYLQVNNYVQANPAPVYAAVTANVNNVVGNSVINATAIGNNVNINTKFGQ